MENIRKEHIKELMGVKGKPDIIYIIEKKKTTMVWPRQKNARGENIKINYGMDTKGKKRGRQRNTWMDGVQAAMTARNLEQDQWRNREQWRLVSGRW
jgi:hypothetical protein